MTPRRKVLMSLLALVAALGIGGGWHLLRQGEAEPASRRTAIEPSALGGSTPREKAWLEGGIETPDQSAEVHREAAERAEHQPVADMGRWVARGRALRADESPFGGARILCTILGAQGVPGAIQSEAEVVADDQGAFEWMLPAAPGRDGRIKLSSPTKDYYAFAPERTIAANSEAPIDLELRLWALDVVVRGVVKNASGEVLAAARVRAPGTTVETSVDGSYELTTTADLGEITVDVSARHHANQRQVTRATGPGATIQLDFVLGAALRIGGRVVDEAGMPVEGASVATFYTLRNPVLSDAEGHYEADGLDPKRERHTLFARKEGYCATEVTVVARGAMNLTQELVLKRGTRIEGHLVDEADQPIANVALYIGFSRADYNLLDARTDAEGRFVFPAVNAGAQTLVAEHLKYAPLRISLDVATDQRILPVRLTMKRGHFAAGVVRDEAGVARAGVRVWGKLGDTYLQAETTTDERGRFRIEGLPREGASLAIDGVGLVSLRHSLPEVDRDDLEIVVQRAGRIAGRVVDGVTGEGLNDFVVRFVRPTLAAGEKSGGGYSATWAREGRRFLQTNGEWHSGGETLAPGTFLGLEVRAEGYGVARVPRVLIEVDPVTDQLIIRMQPPARIHGVVRDSNGALIRDVEVAWRPDGDAAKFRQDEPHEFGVVRSDEHGAFVIAGVPPGSAVLLIAPPGRPTFADGPFEVEAGSTQERAIVLPRGERLTGEIYDHAGRPVVGASLRIVIATEPNGRFLEETTSDDAGAFAFENVAPGRYNLSQVLTRGSLEVQRLTQSIEIENGVPKHVVLRAAGAARLRGKVHMDRELPEILTLSLLSQEATEGESEVALRYGTFAEQGAFAFEGLRPGSYILFGFFQSGESWWQGAQKVEVAEGESAPVDFELRRTPQ